MPSTVQKVYEFLQFSKFADTKDNWKMLHAAIVCFHYIAYVRNINVNKYVQNGREGTWYSPECTYRAPIVFPPQVLKKYSSFSSSSINVFFRCQCVYCLSSTSGTVWNPSAGAITEHSKSAKDRDPYSNSQLCGEPRPPKSVPYHANTQAITLATDSLLSTLR